MEQMINWNKQNREYHNQLQKEWRTNNCEYSKEYHKEYIKNNPDKQRKYNKSRQKKKHKITKKEWLACKNYFNNSCAYCEMTEEQQRLIYNEDLHKEHVDDNGANDLSNCVPSCKNCNSHKWKYEFNDWYNESNSDFTEERYNKILKWTNEDYLKYKNKKFG